MVSCLFDFMFRNKYYQAMRTVSQGYIMRDNLAIDFSLSVVEKRS